MKIAYKIWLENDGKAFGEGPYQLLQLIAQQGSLHQAAKTMGMSYQKAWVIIRRGEEKLGFPLIERKVGGVAGGGSRLTDEGKEFMKTYGRFRKETEKKLNALFHKYFGQSFSDSPKQTKKKGEA